MPLTLDHRARLMGACPLFAGLDGIELERLAEAAVEVDFAAERVIARQGEIGTGFFVIVEGSVRVVRDGKSVARLGPGDFFGELSVIDGAPRNAQVVAEEPVRVLALATWDFERLLRETPGIALTVLRVVVARLRQAAEDHRT
jgi:CRP/FNR family transcriptional regulator, cyclic AMP receptor protein